MGGNWADEDWKVTVAGNAGRSAMNHFSMAKAYSDPECVNWTAEDAVQAFLDGKAVVCETSPEQVILKADDPSQSQIVGNWALGLIPHDKTSMTTLTAWDATIPVGSQNKDLAWEWIKMYTSSEMQNRIYDEHTIFSPRKAFWEQEKMADLSVIREALDHGNSAWRISAYSEANDAVSEILESFFARRIQTEGAVKQMKKALETALENMPPEEGFKNTNH
jgi:maltose-binding protein MalE